MSTSLARELTVVSRTAAARPRTLRLEPLPGSSREAAYRRLAAVMLRVDVASLANDLRAKRRERRLPNAA